MMWDDKQYHNPKRIIFNPYLRMPERDRWGQRDISEIPNAWFTFLHFEQVEMFSNNKPFLRMQPLRGLTSIYIMMMTVIAVIINHVYINRCFSFKVGRPNCNEHMQVHFFPHFLTDPFYSLDPQSAITKWTPCQPQSQSRESTYNGQFQPRKPH